MKKVILSSLFVVTGLVMLFGFGATPVAATGLTSGSLGVCSFIGPICDALGLNATNNPGGTAISITSKWVNLALTLVFAGIIIISVYIVIKAAVTYIQSQGDETKIAEATKAIKSVFIGIALLFVGVVGVVLVLAFFGGTGLLNSDDAYLKCIADGNRTPAECSQLKNESLGR